MTLLIGYCLAAALGLVLCSVDSARSGQDFANPEPVAILGYAGDAMEPFLSRDGSVLFFNDSNAPGNDTQLHWAEQVDGTTFLYRGELTGANSTALDAVASLDRSGNLYFVSTRSYWQTLATIHRGDYSNGAVGNVELVEGVALERLGWVNFDAEISAHGLELYFVDGFFSGAPVPDSADLVIARKEGGQFVRRADSETILAEINTPALEYAPATSEDDLELFFTRLDGTSQILRAARPWTGAPFGAPEPIAAITGFVEAPTISPDGLSLYYHRNDAGTFRIERVTRTSRWVVFADGFETGDFDRWSGG